MLPKKGIVFPSADELGTYSQAIAHALKYELGSTHQAAKTVMKWTGAGERTVKNWLAAKSGPSGEHLVELIRRSEYVLHALLVIGGRPQVAASQSLVALKHQLAKAIEQIDALIADD
ncbi:MAG: hypothetical protein K2Z80_25645 [Xanthobacteraceae bacterium]|nr:hypothetical protein [Xanthobacteraceae bacterium]